MTAIPNVLLNDGTHLPQLGLGTYKLQGDEGVAAIGSAIESGYRLLDTAVNYGNEAEVGRALRASGLDRDDFVVTTKVPGRHHGYDEAIASAEESLRALGLDRIDLLLIHWPNPSVDRYVDTWRGLVELRERGSVRSIGVSNFTEAMLERLIDETGVTPAVNQIELHPYFPQAAMREVHARLGIHTESWSPLARYTDVSEEPVLLKLAAARGVTIGQLLVRWHLELGSTPIPRSFSADRQRENADVFGFSLSAEEIAAISALERGRLWGYDPNTHEEM